MNGMSSARDVPFEPPSVGQLEVREEPEPLLLEPLAVDAGEAGFERALVVPHAVNGLEELEESAPVATAFPLEQEVGDARRLVVVVLGRQTLAGEGEDLLERGERVLPRTVGGVLRVLERDLMGELVTERVRDALDADLLGRSVLEGRLEGHEARSRDVRLVEIDGRSGRDALVFGTRLFLVREDPGAEVRLAPGRDDGELRLRGSEVPGSPELT